MRVLRQNPNIAVLLIFSLALFFLGVFLYILKLSHVPNNRIVMVRETHTAISKPSTYGRSVVAVPVGRTSNDLNKPKYSTPKVIGKTKVIYYPQTDSTLSQTDYLTIQTTAFSSLTMQASFETHGKRVHAPKNISLRIVLSSTDKRYITDKTFKIYAGAQTLFSKESSLDTTGDDDAGDFVVTTITQEIPYELFVRMSKAEKVRAQIGPSLVELKEGDVEAFRDLLKTIKS